MTTLYKLTNNHYRTWGGCLWGVNVEHNTPGKGDLCGPGWLHAYEDPLLAVLHNPIHGDFDPATMHLWECEGEIGKREGYMKCGTTRLRTIRRIDIPDISPEQRVRYAILCAKEVCRDPDWLRWADNWLAGRDRSPATGPKEREDAAEMADTAWLEARTAEGAGVPCEEAFAMAAGALARAAAAGNIWFGPLAAHAATRADGTIDLIAIAKKAVGND